MTTDRTDRYSRRALLKALGVGMGMLPLLNSEQVIAQTGGVAKRLISITWANGIVPMNFYPPAGPLTGTLPPILAPLEKWKSKVLAMRGAGSDSAMGGIDSRVMVDAVSQFSGHDSYPSLLTGNWVRGVNGGTSRTPTPSIDTLIADQLKTQGFAAPQLNLGIRNLNQATSYGAGGIKNAQENDPLRIYTRLFAGMSTSTVALLARRRSVIDGVIEDLNGFATRLGTEDRGKIDAHLQSIRAIEKQLVAPPTPVGCRPPSNAPTEPLNTTVAGYPGNVKLMIDIIAASVRCDIARTVTLVLIDGWGNSLTFPWLGIPSPDYSAISHNGSASFTQKTLIDTWYYAQVADLVGQLAANPEGASTSLDNSVVLVSNGMNVGGADDVRGLPYLIVGSGGGFFKQGTCVQFPANEPNNRLLTSVCHAMGLQVPSVGATYTGDLDAMLKA